MCWGNSCTHCLLTQLAANLGLILCCPIICANLRGTAVLLSPGITTSGHTQDSFQIMTPPPEVHRRRRQIIGGLPSKGGAALLPVSSACCDSTYAGHCPLLITMSAKLRTDCECPLQRAHHLCVCPSANPLMWTRWRWGFWTELPQERKEAGRARSSPKSH